jgi:hypothetical protein
MVAATNGTRPCDGARIGAVPQMRRRFLPLGAPEVRQRLRPVQIVKGVKFRADNSADIRLVRLEEQRLRNTQVNHADIAQHVTSVNRMFEGPMIARFWNPLTAAGRAALDAVVTRQAQIIA